MKKNLLVRMLGIAVLLSTATSSRGQGKIMLDNYASSGHIITYAGGFGPGLDGTGLLNGSGITWTVGFYYALGDVTGSIASDPSTMADPSTLGGGLVFATGAAGDTTTIDNGEGIPAGGYFSALNDASITGWTSGVITLEMVVYSGSTYGTSNYRAHSTPFLMTPVTGPSSVPAVGSFMPAFGVYIIPEPSTFGLATLGFATLLVFRRRPSIR